MNVSTFMRNGRKAGLIILTAVFTLLYSSVSSPSLQSLGVGAQAPEFSLPDPAGKKHSLAELQGNSSLTVLLFWASWSRDSEGALEDMQKLYGRYKDRGLSVVGINVEKMRIDDAALANIRSLRDDLKLSFPVVVDHGLLCFHSYGVIAVPSTVILDKKKNILFEMSGTPAVGTEEMHHLFAAEFDGEKGTGAKVAIAKFQPDSKALRYWNMGVKALQSERTAKSAEMHFKSAIAADPAFVRPYLDLGTYYSKQDKPDEAREQLEKALGLAPDNAAAIVALGELEMEKGTEATAAKLFEQALEADPTFTPAYYYLGYLSGKSGDMEKAEKLFDQAEKINPLDYRIQLYRGRMYEEQHMLAQATACYRDGLKQLLHLP
jgi:Tfp pilus assembly protein PilF/peroxiredoxin